MKRNIVLFLALTSWMLFSCNKESEPIEVYDLPKEVVSEHVLTVKATIGDASDTKTAVQPDGTSIFWTPGDAINLFYGTASSGQFTTAIEEPALTTDFNGTLSVATGTSTESGVTTQNFWGVYPYNAANTCTGDGVILTIPSVQSGIADSFADKLNPSVATSPGLSLAFYNVGSWFIFSVTESDIVSATLTGHNNEDLAGRVKVTMDPVTNKPITEVQEGVKSITMNPDGGVFEAGKKYYMVVIPAEMTSGLELTLTKSNGKHATWSINSDVTFERSRYLRKLNADNGLVFSMDGVPYDEIWYTTSDDSIYNYQNYRAFGATFISNTYKNGKGVIKFDHPITKVVPTLGSAIGNNKVTSLILPETVTELGRYTLFGLSNLSSFTIPSHVTTIRSYAIDGCRGLTTLNIPDSVHNIESGAIVACSNLERFTGSIVGANERYIIINNEIRCFASGNLVDTDIVIPSGITSIGKAFSYSPITSITLNNNITSLDQSAFLQCGHLERVTFTAPISSLGSQSLDMCFNLTEFVGPNASNDGKLLIINNIAYAYAGAYSSITIPEGVVSFDFSSVFSMAEEYLTEIVFPTSVNHESYLWSYMNYMQALEDIHFSLTTIPEHINLPLKDSKINIHVPICMVEAYKRKFESTYFNIIGDKSKMKNNVLYSTRWNVDYAGMENNDYEAYEFDYFDINDFGANALSRTPMDYFEKDDKSYCDVMIRFDGDITRIGQNANNSTYIQGNPYVIWIPETVTEIEGQLSYYGTDNNVYLYFLGTTPPIFINYDYGMQQENHYIMVPQSALSSYKTEWSWVSERIFGY